MYKIIVSRYNENIDWVGSILTDDVIIYNKGNPDIDIPYLRLSNVGREQHTFFTYIYDNYDSLCEYTIFLQGNPFDHCKNVIEEINNIIINKEHFDFKFLSDWIIDCNLISCRYHQGLPLINVYSELFTFDRNLHFQFGAGGQYIVSRENIHKHSKDFYKKCIEMLKTSINPIEGFCFERFTSLIFNNL